MTQPGIDPKDKRKLEDLIELLESIKGRHTELVTVFIPAGSNVNATTRQLEGEKSTASNIKSSTTRKNVIAALDMIIRELKQMKATPENGLAIYCGNISQREGQQDIQMWVYEPPKPLNVKIYRCDQEFIVEPLKEMAGVDEVYGLLVIDRQHATIGLLEGSQIKVLQKLSSGVPGKVRAGGQSSQRFHRITEGLAKEYYRRVAEEMKKIFFDMKKLKGFADCLNHKYAEVNTNGNEVACKFKVVKKQSEDLFNLCKNRNGGTIGEGQNEYCTITYYERSPTCYSVICD